MQEREARCLDRHPRSEVSYHDIKALIRALIRYQTGWFGHNIRVQMETPLVESQYWAHRMKYLFIQEEQVVSDPDDCSILKPGIYESDRVQSTGVMGVTEVVLDWSTHSWIQLTI